MRAIVWRHRIDILGSESLPKEKWDPLLDDLKAEHVPSVTPTGKRVAIVSSSAGVDAFVYRTANMTDDEIVRILDTYGIPSRIGLEEYLAS